MNRQAKYGQRVAQDDTAVWAVDASDRPVLEPVANYDGAEASTLRLFVAPSGVRVVFGHGFGDDDVARFHYRGLSALQGFHGFVTRCDGRVFAALFAECTMYRLSVQGWDPETGESRGWTGALGCDEVDTVYLP